MPDIFPLEDANAFGVSIFTSRRERERDRDAKFESAVNKNCYSVRSSLHAIRGDYKSRRREGEKDGDGGSWVSLFRVCVRGDMMYACSSCDTRCSQDGKGIIEFERFFFLVWVPYHQRIRTLI